MLDYTRPMKGEVDKSQNIHALKVGEQIMLCKKRDIAAENEFVFLWPFTVICKVAKNAARRGRNVEECIYIKNLYTEHHNCKNDPTIFLLSEKGAEYCKKNRVRFVWKENQKESRHFATIEYKEIKPYFSDGTPNIELFKQLEKSKLFWLWDIKEGPLKLFTKKVKNTRKPLKCGKIAIYRVYTIHGRNDVKIKAEDLENHGLLPSLKIDSHIKIMKYFKDYGLDPVINDDKFLKFKTNLNDIIDDCGQD